MPRKARKCLCTDAYGCGARFKTAQYCAMHCLLYGNYIHVASRHNKQSIFEPHSAALRIYSSAQKSPHASRSDCYAFTRFAPAVFARSSATKQSNNLHHSATCHCPTWSGNLLSKSYDMVCCFHMKWENHKIWFISSAWSGQTTKYGLSVSLEVSKPQNVVCYFHLKWANLKMWFISFTWSE